MSRYVALGSSMAAGSGIRPSADGAPFRAGRSVTANVLTEPQHDAPVQMDALDGSEDLVTVTIGGNYAGHVPLLFAAGVPRLARSLLLLGSRLREQLDPTARDRSLVDVAESLKEVGRTLRQRSPRAKVLSSTTSLCCRPRVRQRLHCPISTSHSAAASPTCWSDSPARPPRTPAASGSASRRPVASTMPGQRRHGRQGSGCRYRAGQRHCTPTRKACAQSPTSSSAWSVAQAI